MTDVQNKIGNELEQAKLEIEATQNNISTICEAIIIAQAFLRAEELELNEIMKRCETLNHHQT